MMKKVKINKFKDWDLFEVLPKGWKIDNTCGSPVHGYDFCTNGKSVLNGGKRALVKTIRKGTPHIEFIEFITETKSETPSKEIDNYSFPAKNVNALARLKFQEQLLKEISFDLMVCEIEGWDKEEYIKELKRLLNGINLPKKSITHQRGLTGRGIEQIRR